jgi:hypothetical protein
VLSAMLMRLTNEIILTLFDFLKNASSHDSDYIRQILASVYVTVMSSCELSKRPKVNTVYMIFQVLTVASVRMKPAVI